MDFLKELLAALGGGMVVLVCFLTFGKSLVSKYLDTLIETSAEKSVKKLENRFARSMTAYEILLKKEFDYYESIDSIYANLIVRVQDCCDEILGKIEKEYSERCEKAREEYGYMLKSIPTLKNNNLQYQAYIPNEIFRANTEVIGTLQRKVGALHPEIKKLFGGDESKIDIQVVEETEKEILMAIAAAEFVISKRLKELSENT